MKTILHNILAYLVIGSIIFGYLYAIENKSKPIQQGICKFVLRDSVGNKVQYIKPCSEVEIVRN